MKIRSLPKLSWCVIFLMPLNLLRSDRTGIKKRTNHVTLGRAKIHRWIIFCACLVVASCSVDHHELVQNNAKIPQTWDAHDPALKIQNAPLQCIPWWHQLHDPVLNKLVTQSLHTNNNIFAAMASVEAAEGELQKIQLRWIPDLNSLLGYSSFPYLGYPGVIAILIPTYTINIFKQIKEQQQAYYKLKISQAMLKGVRLTLIAEIISSYLNYLSNIEALELLNVIEHDLIEFVQIYQDTYKGELFSEIDLVQAKSDLELLRAKQKVVKQNIVVSQNSLRYLLSENPKKFTFNRHFSQLNPNQMIIGGLPLAVIENRPDLIEVTNELNASISGVGIALSDFLPTIQLSLARGDIASVPNGNIFGTPVYFNQALLQTPLLTFSTFGELKKSKGLSRAAYYRYLNTVRRILRDVNDDLSAHDYYSKRLHEMMLATNNIQQKYQLNQKLYDQGIISYADLLTEKVHLDFIRVERNQYKLDQMLTIVRLYQDLAVGYDC